MEGGGREERTEGPKEMHCHTFIVGKASHSPSFSPNLEESYVQRGK